MFETQKNCAPLREFYTKADLALVLLLCAVLLAGMVQGNKKGELVEIQGLSVSWQLPLMGPEKSVAVPGPLGKTVVTVGEGRAAVVSSPCPDRICVRTGKITKRGQAIICAPNHVSVRILGKGKYHALTY